MVHDSNRGAARSNRGSSISGSFSLAGEREMARALGKRGEKSLSEHRAIRESAREKALRILSDGEEPEGFPPPLESDECPTERCIKIIESSQVKLAKLAGG